MKKRSRAFTFIEILIVTAIISLLTGSSTVIYTSFSNQSRDARRKADLEQVRSALETYRSNKEDGSYPASLSFGSGSITDGASIYLNKIPQDPKQGASYSYQISGTTTLGSQTYNTSYILSANLEDDTKYCVTPYTQSVVQKGQSCGEFAVAVIPPTSTPAPIQPTNTPAPIQPTSTPIPQPTNTPAPTPIPEIQGNKVFITRDILTFPASFASTDTFCQSQAGMAGLSGTFKAWTSYGAYGGAETESVRNRFYHSNLPYVMVNGTKIADSFDSLVGNPYGGLLSPINADQFGNPVSESKVFTNTLYTGATARNTNSSTFDCADYDYSLGAYNSYSIYGVNSSTSYVWSNAQGGNPTGNPCLKNSRLYCFEQKANSPTLYAKVFITSSQYDGALGGITGADAKCQSSASAAGVSGSFKAWISDGTSAPSTTFVKSNIPYRLLNGSTVANSWTDLTDGTLINSISITELGSQIQDNYNPYIPRTTFPANVWTNVTQYGNRNEVHGQNTCYGYTTNSPGFYAGAGGAGAKDIWWTYSQGGGYECSRKLSLYCFEQPAVNPAPTPTPIPTPTPYGWDPCANGGCGGDN